MVLIGFSHIHLQLSISKRNTGQNKQKQCTILLLLEASLAIIKLAMTSCLFLKKKKEQ